MGIKWVAIILSPLCVSHIHCGNGILKPTYAYIVWEREFIHNNGVFICGFNERDKKNKIKYLKKQVITTTTNTKQHTQANK